MAPPDPNQTAGSTNNTTPAASTSNSSSVANPTNPALPVTALTISNGMFSTLSNNTKFPNLCLSKDNWPKWSQKIIEVMEMSELDEYLYGKVPQADITADLASFKNWKGNNKKLIGFLKAYVEDGEKPYLQTDVAHTAWTSLINRHEKQGPITQVRLIQEALSISYPKDVTAWSATTDRIRDLCNRIFAQAVPTQDVLFMVTMLNALEHEADHIRSKMTGYYISNKTASLNTSSRKLCTKLLAKLT